ncbi:MAG: ATP-binding protein [Deltaproteobacteria bacterium]|nr:ATP-binding protein [Deltaproteobacteria bacterium]
MNDRVNHRPYLPRHLAPRLRAYLDQFAVVLLLGARQVGKTTFLQRELDGWTRVDLEDQVTADRVASDPALFLRDHPDRVWFDEAHRVPTLFGALRLAVDRDRRPGRFVLSGSATGALTESVSESLAGRAGILVLEPFSVAERLGRGPSPFLARLLECGSAAAALKLAADRDSVRDRDLKAAWFSGGFPEPSLLREAVAARRWFDSYLRLVSERDLAAARRDLRPAAVHRLLRMLAARQGQPLNLTSLGGDFAVSVPSLKGFLDLLEGAFLWRRVEAYSANVGKRLVKAPRGWIVDTGLLHALLGLRGPDDLEVHPLAGASWEGWLIQQLSAQASLLDAPPPLLYWRTHQGAEVDIVLESGRHLIPIEVKHGARVTPYDVRGLASFLESHPRQARFGVVLCRSAEAVRLAEHVVALPVTGVL